MAANAGNELDRMLTSPVPSTWQAASAAASGSAARAVARRAAFTRRIAVVPPTCRPSRRGPGRGRAAVDPPLADLVEEVEAPPRRGQADDRVDRGVEVLGPAGGDHGAAGLE